MHNIMYCQEPENVNRKKVMQYITEYAEANGDGYHGPLNWHDEIEPLADYAEAKETIKALINGRYDDHAVRYYDYSKYEPTKKILELANRREEVKGKMGQYLADHSVRKLKAEYIGCPNCGSKLARKHLTCELCPVCRADLRSETTLKRLEAYGKRIEALDEQIEAEKKKQKKARRVMWLIKLEFHS